MIVAITEAAGGPVRARAMRRLVEVATVVAWILAAGVVAASYVGHSSSPYGSCHNASGRGIQCLAGHH